MEVLCYHFDPKTLKREKEHVCEECIKTGDPWVHLRTCQECGVTLCCDNSPNQHSRKHYHESKHPVIISAEPGENWAWCYPDGMFIEY